MKLINIFISSAERELELEREIAGDAIESLNLEPVLFELSPALSNSPYEGFLDKVDKCDIFVMMLWKTFTEAVKAEYKRALQKHKPILIFLKNARPGEIISEDLQELIDEAYSNKEPGKYPVKSIWKDFRGAKDLQAKLRKSILEEIGKFYQEPRSTSTRQELYEIGQSIIDSAQRRLLMFQRTPTLFLGTKDRMVEDAYNAKSYQTYEKDFLEALIQWIKKYAPVNNVTLTYLFDLKKTKEELKKFITEKNSETITARITENIAKYKELEKQTNYRFTFNPIDKPVSGPFIVGDNRYGIWIMGDDDAVSFSQENEKVATTLTRIISSYTPRSLSANEMIESLLSAG